MKQEKYLAMKKIVASVGLVALSASSLQAVEAAMPSEFGRFWSVQAALRGFYDDNINTIPSNQPVQPGYSRASAGFEVSPSIFLNVPLEQTSIGVSYVYDFKYYDNKPQGQSENYSQTQIFEAAINHAFNERYQISAKDSFVIGQEPDMLRAGNTYNTFQRISGDNIRNYGVLNFSAQITPVLGAEVGYANTLFNYSDSSVAANYFTGEVSPSNAGLLNTMDQTIHLDARMQIQPQTIGIVGYQFRAMDYTADQLIGGNIAVPGSLIKSDVRNFYANYIYVGIDHNFRPDLTGSFRAGASYNDYYNNDSNQNGLAPYALLSLRWTYNPQCYVEGGFTYDFTTGTAFNPANGKGDLTLGAYAASLYGTVRHQITGKLSGSIIAQIQNDNYYGGSYNNANQNYFLLYLGLEYQFNHYVSAQIGYDYDNVWGDIAQQNYNRNRVYLGVTATY
ncbi:MAG: outer membrane beta-barrel protein [Verrucomicrobiota bacterium]